MEQLITHHYLQGVQDVDIAWTCWVRWVKKLGMGREQGQSEDSRSLRILNLNLAVQIII